jgi:hypothetical protein
VVTKKNAFNACRSLYCIVVINQPGKIAAISTLSTRYWRSLPQGKREAPVGK